MDYVLQVMQAHSPAAGACALAWIALTLLWRQRRQQAAVLRLTRSLAQECQARQLAEQALADTRRQVDRLSASQHSLRDADRRRIARDLHDDLGQQLLTLTLDLDALARQHPAMQVALARIMERVRQASRAMRSIVSDLAPDALRHGLQHAVERHVAQFSRLSGIPCRLDAQAEAYDEVRAAPAGTELNQAIYRILQESLSNIVRHAQASQVSVALNRAAGHLDLVVRDNGVGLPPSSLAPPARPGSGLRGIAERVSEAGGQIDVASAPGRGTALTMSFPIH